MAKRRPEPSLSPITCFVDECLGRHDVPDALKKVEGVLVALHHDHFAAGTKDVDWLPIVAAKDWVILTKDERITRRRLEVRAWKETGATVVALQSQDLSGEEMGKAFSAALPRIRHWLLKYRRPLIVSVSAGGIPTVRYGERIGGKRTDTLGLDG